MASNKQYIIIFSSVGYENDTLIIPAKLQNTAIEVNLKPVDFQLEELQVSSRNE
ncbi:hypothetical protein [Runella zeae]|uniref:hypothetical protein n=1 Tax=Runella zeae TaxID=94255 RepID=UPI002352103A|nr:hypothetical protein [Runella zeae]